MNNCKLLAVAIMSGALCAVAVASDGIVGAYLGAGFGSANVRVDDRPGDIALGLEQNHSAWKVLAGVRPISLLGVELSYMDFGKVSETSGLPNSATTVVASARQTGGSIQAVGYLPLPLPWLDIYAKAGAARIQTNVDGFLPSVQCAVAGCNEFQGSSADTSFSWGAGTQLKLPLTGLSVRAEYERFDVPNGAPELVSVSLLWRL
jgi:opacity protein-like surface antigen